MRISRLSTTHFRNLETQHIDFSPGVNVFVGENGHGKTNILEAVYFFRFGRSFRTQRDNDLVRFGQPFCRMEVEAAYTSGDVETYAASIERRGGKTVKLSGKDVPKISELVGRYPAVLFGPHDLALVSGFAAERRRFLDMTGSMTDPSYLEAVRGYRRVLNQRNAALKRGAPSVERRAWTEKLVTHGCTLVARRTQLVESVREHLMPHIEALSVPYSIGMAYESEITSDLPDGISSEEHFVARLAAVESDELRRRTTLIGPHRDDLGIIADGRDLRRYGSQGQRRLFAVLLRLAELTYLERELRETCVLLLDDLFSELDDEVSEKLKSHLQSHRQIFVTTPVPIEWEGEKVSSFSVRQGAIVAS